MNEINLDPRLSIDIEFPGRPELAFLNQSLIDTSGIVKLILMGCSGLVLNQQAKCEYATNTLQVFP